MSTQPESEIVNEQTSTTDSTSTQPSLTSSVSDTLSELLATVEQQQRSMRDLHRQLKKLEKEVIREHKRLSKVQRPKRKVVQKPVVVSKTMRKFLTKMKEPEHADGGWTRQVMMRVVAAYVKTKDLQIADNRKNWKPDSTLTKLFALESGKLYSFMNINGLISRVVIKPTVAK